MSIDYSGLNGIYQSAMDAHITGMGETVTLYFRQTEDVTGSSLDAVRGNNRLPEWKQQNVTKTDNTDTVTAIVHWQPKDFLKLDLRVDKSKTVIRLKTMLTDYAKLKRCEYIEVAASAVKNTIGGRFKLIKDITPYGFQSDRYAYSYWEII